MQIILFIFLCLHATTLRSTVAEPIENYFPQASHFKASGIKVHPTDIRGIVGYEIEKFTEAEKNRNHWDSREGKSIEYLVMHYTVGHFPATLLEFTKNASEGRTSAHYIITEKDEKRGIKAGIPIQLVPENERAWHAGISYWRGVNNLNATSIGIENVNETNFITGTRQLNWMPFDPDQIATLGALSHSIINDYNIPPYNVVGHADIAPSRKHDPGILFPWEELYEQYKVGAWITKEEQNRDFILEVYKSSKELPSEINEAFFFECLQDYGYEVPQYFKGKELSTDQKLIIKNFKAHFSHNQMPQAYTEEVDEKAMYWAWALAAKYPQGNAIVR